jgi:tripartite ATP-independent transporter DctM subunit
MGTKGFEVMTDVTYVAIPLFIFRGSMLQMSGVAQNGFGALTQWLRKIKGGLGIATVIICVIFGCCVGVVGASVTTMALLTLPPMLANGYKKSLATGIVAAGGSLGILLPPSIMMVVMGPVAGVSVIKLFAGTIIPGLMLGLAFGLYVFIITRVRKDMVPEINKNDTTPLKFTLGQGLVAFIPLLVLILAVLGAIFFGIAAPSEAAGVGALGAIIIAAGYRKCTGKALSSAALTTLRASTMVMFVILGAKIFTAVFFYIGGTKVVATTLSSIGLGSWGTFALVLMLVFLLGIFLDWVGVILIVVPVFMPILVQFGFDPLYVCIIMLVLLQTSFITPPFAYTIFYIMGVAPPGVTIVDVYRGVVPFICLQLIVVIVCVASPEFMTFLPNMIVRI